MWECRWTVAPLIHRIEEHFGLQHDRDTESGLIMRLPDTVYLPAFLFDLASVPCAISQ